MERQHIADAGGGISGQWIGFLFWGSRMFVVEMSTLV